MMRYFICPVSDPLLLGITITSHSLDQALEEYIKLYSLKPCVVYDASICSESRYSFLSNLRYVDFISKNKLKKIINKSTYFQAGFF